ncbi:DinB family protein [Aquimarina gracilis]|uniref:DinB family protein n=1 Tax=Aquimarina gracilis TaxID=874422 RepID=A0ABU5ZT44_9FLAO|nr:DinB family protein [Aquimarina gracilis]MEB3345128.1 DinB family protein [Aquimarina gracilis]
MVFDINKSIEILQRTPLILESLLQGISKEWVENNEGENTWSAYDIVGHLIHGEKTDWIPRAKVILSKAENKTFDPFDRFAQMNKDQERTIEELLKEFKEIRSKNIEELKSFQINETKLSKKGIHPELGEVNLKELLSTWVVHDLGHISQISRVMAKQFKSEVGPWSAYLGILKK